MERQTFTFSNLPQNLAQLQAVPEAGLQSPFQTAALTVLALCVYAKDRENGRQMLDFLKGPQPLSPYELQFLADRFRDKDYVPRSYFAGSTPENDYTPSAPYQITVSDNPYSYQQDGYAVLYLKSGGADSERSVKLRRKGDQWFLWEQFLLPDIRKPKALDPWA